MGDKAATRTEGNGASPGIDLHVSLDGELRAIARRISKVVGFEIAAAQEREAPMMPLPRRRKPSRSARRAPWPVLPALLMAWVSLPAAEFKPNRNAVPYAALPYAIPADSVKAKQKVTVRFQATNGNEIAAVFGVRMIRADSGRCFVCFANASTAVG